MIKNKTYNPLIDPGTGDYIVTNGDIEQDFSLQFPAYVRMKTQKKKWLYAPNDTFGSDLYKVKKKGNNTPRLLEAMTYKALQPMIEDGRAKQIEVLSKPLSRNMCNIEITIIETNNTIQTFEFNPVE